jgi:hypothetical protein
MRGIVITKAAGSFDMGYKKETAAKKVILVFYSATCLHIRWMVVDIRICL